MSQPSHRTCARCGAQNPANATVCTRCGQTLLRPEEVGRLWSSDGPDPASQVTAPFQQPRAVPESRPYQPRGAEPAPASDPFTRAPIVNYPPVVSTAARRRRGPHGCILGGLALVIILAVVAFFAWTVSKPLISDRVRDELDRGISTQVAAIDSPRIQTAGPLILTEDQINSEVDQYAGSYDPVKDVRVSVLPDEVQVRFDLYGVTSTLRGDLAVENRRIVVVDPDLSGPAGQMLDARDIADVFETQLAALMDRSNVEPTAVELGDGELTITTRSKAR